MSRELRINPNNPLQLLREDAEVLSDTDLAFQEDSTGNKRKRKGVQVETEDSSDDENASRKDGDDDDMFGDNGENADNGEDKENEDEPHKRLDMKKFESEGDIKIYDLEEQESDEAEEAVNMDYYNNPEEEHIGKNKRAEPKLDAFHLRNDLEEGDFDEEGNFIRNAEDEMAHQDTWLEGISSKSIKKAKEAHESRIQSEPLETFEPKSDTLVKLVPLLQPAETPMEALQRLAPKRPARKKHATTKTVVDGLHNQEELGRKQDVETITGCCEKLLDGGVQNAYELSREELSRMYQRETGETVPDLKRKRDSDSAPTVEWEFQWEGADQVYGPYPTAHMIEWQEAGYFDERARIRQVGESEYTNYSNVNFQRYLE
jgi:CD2 antigen cytoplasmic tail-binding protein 2